MLLYFAYTYLFNAIKLLYCAQLVEFTVGWSFLFTPVPRHLYSALVALTDVALNNPDNKLGLQTDVICLHMVNDSNYVNCHVTGLNFCYNECID